MRMFQNVSRTTCKQHLQVKMMFMMKLGEE